MATKKSTAMVSAPSEETVALLGNLFPTETGFQRAFLPRLGMFSQNKFEVDKKTKQAVLIQEAGMFYLEKQDEEESEDENGESKRLFRKAELGTDPIEGIIVYVRKQLSMYDSAIEAYTSSPIYDNDDEILPLFCNKAEIARGTPAELKALYPGTTLKGKPKSELDDNRILYVLFKGPEDEEEVMYQLNLRGTSMYSFQDYRKKVRPNVPLVITSFSSEPQKNGDTEWNKMTFSKVRDVTKEESETVVAQVTTLADAIKLEKEQYAQANVANDAFAAHQSSLPQGSK